MPQAAPSLEAPLVNIIPAVDNVEDIIPPEEGEECLEVISYLLRQGADVNCVDNYNQSPLHYAATKGNIEAIALLLSWPGIDLEVTDTAGGTALHSACGGNAQPGAVRLLLMAGANLMVWDNEHQSPFHHAATAEGGKHVLQEIINIVEEKGGVVENWKLADMINDQDNQGQGVLHRAVDFGHYEMCSLLLKKGAKVNLCRENFATPLHLAATTGDLEIVKLLVSHGANLEALNIASETPLHRASRYIRVDIIKYLLGKGCNIDADDQNNKTPLILASANCSKEAVAAVQALLISDADITQVDSTEKSAIYWAAEENAVDVLKLLLEKTKEEASLQYLIEQTDRFDNTPLHVSAKKGFRLVVNMLIEYNANVDCCNDEELTPLHLAAINGNHKVAVALLTKQASIINDQDESGNTALHLAALNGHVKLIELLIDWGGSVDAKNIMLCSPLDCAASNGHSDCCIRLLERDAPIDSLDLARTTPLHIASREGYVEAVQVLLDKGADVTIVDHEGKNALDMAVDNSHREVALVILEHKDWLLAAKNRSREGKSITTPMRKLIKKLPDVAYILLNKCMKLSTDLPYDAEDFQVRFFYELIDDTYANWCVDYDEGEDKSTVASTSESGELEDDANRLTGPILEIMEKKETHPLSIMCENNCDKLLMHPLCLSLIYEKWQKFGRVVFYSKFSLYFIFLLFYTAFILVSTPIIPRQKKINGTDTCVPRATAADKETIKIIVFFMAGRIVLLVLSFLQLLLEVPQMISGRLAYLFDLNNWLEWAIFGSAILFAWPDFDHLIEGSLETMNCITHISIGAMGIFVSWINLLLFLQKFPTLGIYVVMFLDVTNTFLKFSVTFILFVFSFALGFYTLLHDKFPLTYDNIGSTAVKTTVMMIGEFDFDSLFNGGEVKPPMVTWLLFVIFVVIMTILLTNLMVGLAVDDIKAVLDQAVMTRISMQVNLVIDVEKSLPRTFRIKYLPGEKLIYPNKEFKWYAGALTSHITRMEEIEAAIKPKKTVSDVVQEHTQAIRDSVDKLKFHSKDMGKQLKGIEKMVQKLLTASNLADDDDDDNY